MGLGKGWEVQEEGALAAAHRRPRAVFRGVVRADGQFTLDEALMRIVSKMIFKKADSDGDGR